MEIRAYNEWEPLISQVKARKDENKVIINFKWPNTLDNVCIYKRSILQRQEIDKQKPYRKYTREEYIQFGGFVDPINEVGLIDYVICPFILDEDGAYVVWYANESNSIEVSTGKIQIRYTIKEKKKLFSNRKTVQISVFCDTEIPRHLICYTKKKGEIPLKSDDGSQFQFVQDFNAGNNVLPEIEVDKDEHIRVFLTENVEHKEIYWIYKQ